MGALADVSLGDIVQALKRYRPVIATVAIVSFVLMVVLPDPPRPAPSTATAPFAARAVRAAPSPPSTATPTAVEAAAPVAASPGMSFAPAPTGGSSPFAPAGSSGAGPTFSGGGDAAAMREDVTFAAPTFVQPGQEEAAKAPLTIAGRAWHTRSAGTPVASEGVPPGTLPVGTRATLVDKLSVVRLAGEADVLQLSEDPAGGRNTAGAVAVQMCPVTKAGWPEGEAKPMQDAPPYDAAKCVNGARSPEGVWTFDLSSFDTRVDDRGFAIVPGAGAGPDFQVAFSVS